MSETLIRQAERRTHVLLRQAEDHYGVRFPLREIRFDLRGKSAGMVVFPPGQQAYIRYNPQLLRLNQQRFLSQTPAHEVSHLVARSLFGKSIRPHGPEWKSVMAFFGVEPVRCHTYELGDTPSRNLRRFDYACACRQHQLTSIRHNRVQRGQVYRCRGCGEALSPLE
jgi:SprT protein